MQKNNKKMTCLAAILMAALAALLIFAIIDANRINRSLSELQQTVNYEERLEPLLFYGATAETAETAATAETAKTLEPELNFTVTKSGIVPDDGSYVPAIPLSQSEITKSHWWKEPQRILSRLFRTMTRKSCRGQGLWEKD